MTIREGQERLADALLKPINPAAIILLGIFTVVWGFWVGSPFWKVFPTAEAYSEMAFLPESVWGLVALAAGLVIIHGAITRTIGYLILGAGVGGIFWLVVGLMLLAGEWQSTLGISALILWVYAVFIYLNLKVNCQYVDHDDELFS